MTIRGKLVLFALFAVPAASPALADCCDGWLSCGAAYVTDGLSCEIEAVLDTVKAIGQGITNMLNDLTGKTAAQEQYARQSVTEAINSMQTSSQQASTDLANAQSQGQTIYEYESHVRSYAEKTVANAGLTSQNSNASAIVPGQPVSMQRVQSARAMTPAAGSSVGSPLKTAVLNGQSTGVVPLNSTLPPPGALVDLMQRSAKQIASLKSTGDQDFADVESHLTLAQNSIGPGVQSADQIAAQAIMAPLQSIQTAVADMITHPWTLYDPTSWVDSVEDSVTNSLGPNFQRMQDAITTAPINIMGQTQASYSGLHGNAEAATEIAAAMTRAYQQRTPAAVDALAALLPLAVYAGTTTRSSVTATLNSTAGGGMTFAAIKAAATRQNPKIILAVTADAQQIHSGIAQLRAKRSQGKMARTPTMVAQYRSNLTQQLHGLFSGKAPAAVAAQRDQMISQVQTQYANDPKTANALIALLNSEAGKYGGAAVVTVAQGVGNTPTSAQPAAPLTRSNLQFGVKAQTSPVAPVPAPNQSHAQTWGSTPAWSMPAPPVLRKAPAQQTQQPATLESAPSSMSR